MSQGLHLQEFFGEDLSEDVVESVQELRAHLADYNQASAISKDGSARMKAAKEAIQRIFEELPEDIKASQNVNPTEVAGQTFARTKKTITIDGYVIIVNEKINTSFSRVKFSDWLDGQITSASTIEDNDERVVRQNTLREVKQFIDDMLSPHKDTEMKIEPVKPQKS